jgi:CheY-like chemotaxis protein
MNILCIDDDELGLKIRKLMLEQEGHTVLTAASGEAGLRLLRESSVDVVILDYNMPGLDGAQVARIIKEISPNLPVIMLSGCADLVPHAALDLVSALLVKGGAPEQLLVTIDKFQGDGKARITILNVDDNEQHRYTISRVLENAGFIVIEASTGGEALAKVADLPDLVMLDVNLPDMLGFEVCKRLKANPVTRKIPVIHISATYGADWAEQEALDAGAECFLRQPQDPMIVVELVRAEIRKRYPAA